LRLGALTASVLVIPCRKGQQHSTQEKQTV
jgi:hypothetical protein